jgi:hypothetical protein
VSDQEVPPEHEPLDRALRGVRFEPRASLGPELLGRVRRGERSKGAVSSRSIRPALLALAAAVVAAAVVTIELGRGPDTVSVDRCCFDLDGGGDADDGVVLLAERDAEVHRLRLYEDRDGSGSFTVADVIRIDRDGAPALHGAASAGLVTTEHCCLDFDGGGFKDDGLLVIGVPPDQVVLAAIYERPSDVPAGDPMHYPLR